MTTSATTTSAHAALREATRALSVRRDSTSHADLSKSDFQALSADLADTLEAVASLLRSVGVGVHPNATTHGLRTVAEQVDMSGLMARQASGTHEEHVVPAMRVEPERCGCTDG